MQLSVIFKQLFFSVPTYAAQNADTRRVVQTCYPFMSKYSMAQKHLYFSWVILQFSKKKYFVSVDFQLRVEIKSVRPARLLGGVRFNTCRIYDLLQVHSRCK